MEIGYVNMERNGELAFEWDWGHDGSRRVKVLTTNGGYEIYNAYYVKMNLDQVPSDFISDFSVDRFIYYPESDDEDAYVKEDRYLDSYMEEKKRLKDLENPEPEPEPDQAEEETYSKKEYDELLEQMKKQQEEMEEMKRQFEEFKKMMNGGSSNW